MNHLKKENAGVEKQLLSRREALKALTALGGAATLLMLPNKWEKPLVQVGALPVFAQATPTCSEPSTISNLSVSDRQGGCDPGGGEPGDLFSVGLSYTDTCGLIPDQARLRATFEFLPSRFTDSSEVVLGPINITGNESGFTQGDIVVPICVAFGSDTSVNLTVSVINGSWTASNELTAGIANPSGSATQGGQQRVTILEP